MAAAAWMAPHVTCTLMIEGQACKTLIKLKAKVTSMGLTYAQKRQMQQITMQEDAYTDGQGRLPCTKRAFQRRSSTIFVRQRMNTMLYLQVGKRLNETSALQNAACVHWSCMTRALPDENRQWTAGTGFNERPA